MSPMFAPFVLNFLLNPLARKIKNVKGPTIKNVIEILSIEK